MGYYYHYVPGRLRIRTPFMHGNLQNGKTFARTVLALEGITSVKTNPVIGSALIHFDEKRIKHKQIIGFLEKKGYFSLAKARTSDQVIKHAAEMILEHL